jgi:hypothetical protein
MFNEARSAFTYTEATYCIEQIIHLVIKENAYVAR